MPKRIAVWNRARSVWETEQGLLCEHSDVFSEIWPNSGMTRDGVAYALPTWEPRTTDIGCSLLPTPLNGADSPAAHGQISGRFRQAMDAALSLLPTPKASDHKRNASPAEIARNSPALGAVVTLLPTPRATDGTKGGPNQRGSSGDLMLPSAVQLLPTPTAADHTGSGGSNPTHVTLTDAVVRSQLGARTNPRFDAGNEPPAQLPLPASPDEPGND